MSILDDSEIARRDEFNDFDDFDAENEDEDEFESFDCARDRYGFCGKAGLIVRTIE